MRRFFIVTLSFFPWLCSSVDAVARDLTFDERVKAQAAIEQVYYSHQIGATMRFEEAVPRSVLEKKVRTYLKQSVALEELWQTPVTGEALRKELERMARQTRSPERLRELYSALGGDAFLIEECLARPVLVDRLVRNFFAFDSRIHAEARKAAEGLRDRLLRGDVDIHAQDPRRTLAEVVRVDAGQADGRVTGRRTTQAARGGPLQLELTPDEFARWRAGVPRRPGEIGPMTEARDAFVFRVLLAEGADRAQVATYAVSKITRDEWWDSSAAEFHENDARAVASTLESPPAPSSEMGDGDLTALAAGCVADDTWDDRSLRDDVPHRRWDHTVVWTGSVMVGWGGRDLFTEPEVALNTGSRYDPVTDTWAATSTRNAPPGGSGYTAVWAGSVMIVWRGDFDNGGRYDPVADVWTPISTIDAPSGLSGHTAVWTGQKMVIWGGYTCSCSTSICTCAETNSGWRYDPAADIWTPTSTIDAPSGRSGHTAVWTGHEMVVWGGVSCFTTCAAMNSGGRYDPVSDTWMATSTLDAPSPLLSHSAVWTGSFMVIWGTRAGTGVGEMSGGRYDPVRNSWLPISTLNAPFNPYGNSSAVWTGSYIVVLSDGAVMGGRYDSLTDTWLPLSTINAPPVGASPAVWTGSLVLSWNAYLRKGGRYDPSSDTWTSMASSSAPVARHSHTAVWTGNEMIIWGGVPDITDSDHISYMSDGDRYDPATDSWMPLSTLDEPSGRAFHSAIWTGSEMVIWGGSPRFCGPCDNTTFLNTGGRYDPITDRWAATTTENAPSARGGHTAIWTGREMIVWGGQFEYDFVLIPFNTGGRYDPVSDRWVPTTLTDAPASRSGHSAVWTGRQMIIWGGDSGGSYPLVEYNTGGRYDPLTDTWTVTSETNSPPARSYHSAIWTGSSMVVWGGSDNSGGRYDPVADAWMSTSTAGAPSSSQRRFEQFRYPDTTAVWTGRLMIVWNGSDGGRYDPARDVWSPVSTTKSPQVLGGHSAVWTGTSMLVWGGAIYPYGIVNLASGGIYLADSSPDTDNDGVTVCGGDCGDGDAAVHPGATEVCNGVDDDCNGEVDEIPPTITCLPDVVMECPVGQVELGHPATQPGCDPSPVVSNDAPGELRLGTTLVTWTAADSRGRTASCQQPVTVVDTTAPRLSIGAAPPLLWPPNHRMVEVAVSVESTDACSVPVVVLTSVFSNEPDDAPEDFDGHTADDILGASGGTADFALRLRAERDGNGSGRAYALTYTATDSSGNHASGTGFVFVPHDQGLGEEPLMLSASASDAGTLLNWSEVPRAVSYDVVRGDLRNLRETENEINLGPVTCIAAHSLVPTTVGHEDPAMPQPGEAFFYLVEYSDEWGRSSYGSADVGKPRVVASGDCL